MAFLESSKDLYFVLRNTLNIKTGMNMDITKNDLLEMNITDIHEKCESRTKFRSCRILYDFIEGDLNKEHIDEWAKLEVCELWNLQALLKVGCEKHIEETLEIINSSNNREEASIRLEKRYGFSRIVHERNLELPLFVLTEVQNKEEEYHKAIMRRKLLFNFLQLLSTTSDLYK